MIRRTLISPLFPYTTLFRSYRAFLLFEFNSKVIDIRESFPLLDVMEVIDDKEDLRFDKFTDRETKEPYVLTTNFLLTVKVDRKSTRLNSSHVAISYAVFCLK